MGELEGVIPEILSRISEGSFSFVKHVVDFAVFLIGIFLITAGSLRTAVLKTGWSKLILLSFKSKL